MALVKEFRSFILPGNVVDLAVGFIVGAAFNAVVQGLVKDIFTPAIGLVFNFHFAGLEYHKGHTAYVLFGTFLNTLISFLIVAAVVFFFVVKPMNAWAVRQAARSGTGASAQKACPYCYSQIAAEASRCAFCTSDLSGAPRPPSDLNSA